MVGWLVDAPSNQTDNQPANQPTSQPISQPTNEPTNRSINQRTNEPTNQPTNQANHQTSRHPYIPTSLGPGADWPKATGYLYIYLFIYIYIYILELHSAYPCTFLCCSVIGLLGSPVGLAWVALIGLASIDQSKAALYSQVASSWL